MEISGHEFLFHQNHAKAQIIQWLSLLPATNPCRVHDSITGLSKLKIIIIIKYVVHTGVSEENRGPGPMSSLRKRESVFSNKGSLLMERKRYEGWWRILLWRSCLIDPFHPRCKIFIQDRLKYRGVHEMAN